MRTTSFILVFILSFVSLHLIGQYNGGMDDGFSMYITEFSSMADQSSYCSGGIDDGFAYLVISPDYLFDQSAFCSGGIQDGADVFLIGLDYINDQSFYCNGGINDGFEFLPIEMSVYVDQHFYCSGGINDGFDFYRVNINPFNDQYLYCAGGIQDGFDFFDTTGTFYQPEISFSGGIEDGWASLEISGEMFPGDYCKGGIDDGFTMFLTGFTYVNPQGFYCSGGINDGFDGFSFTGNIQSWMFCHGGIGDGFDFDTTGVQAFGYGIWTGASSNLWTMASNWRNNMVPDSSMRVTIPSGTPYFPVLHQHLSINSTVGTFQCRRLDILNGGQLITNNSLTVDGILIVGGTLTFYKRFSNMFQINPTGTFVIKPGGSVTLQEE